MKNYRVQVISLLIFCFLFCFLPLRSQVNPAETNVNINLKQEEENLNVLDQWIRWNNPGSLLINYLNKNAFAYYDLRDSEIKKLTSENDWLKRQNLVREKLAESIGPLPLKTSLNPRITGVLKMDGFRIEKVVFESFPGFYVTGCLYVPDKVKGRAPAILNVIGHNQEAFRAPLYQVINYNLVKKGMIVFAIDPPGQGEHVQNYDEKVKFSSVGYSVIEHCYFGNQCFLTGYSCARYFIWDGIRAIDYLVSRKEVDPERIGLTGFSGGGTVTSYIAALDERVKVAVPCSWATSNKRLLETKGAQDAESVLYHSLKNGISLEDLLEVRAPRPTLLTFVSRDEYLSLQGAREAFEEAGKAYEAFGNRRNLKFTEDDSKHWLTPKIRLAIYSFFLEHFNLPGNPAELEAEILSPEELTVTPTGQISTSLGGNMIFDENRKIAEELVRSIEKSREDKDRHLKYVKEKARELSGFAGPGNNESTLFINGKYQRDGYTVGKYAIEVGDDYIIPLLLFIPDDKIDRHPALIYLNPEGKAAGAKPDGEIEKLVRQGFIVAAMDPLGTGETKNSAARGLSDGYTAVLIGKSIVGIQAEDIVRVAAMLKKHKMVDYSRIGAIGIDEMCIPLLHAAAFDSTISKIILNGPLVSYRSVVLNRNYRIGFTSRVGGGFWHPYELDFSWGVAGALTVYDLPDLIGCLAPRKIILTGLKNEMLEPASDELIKTELSFPLSVYSSRGVPENIMIGPPEMSYGSMTEWSFQ